MRRSVLRLSGCHVDEIWHNHVVASLAQHSSSTVCKKIGLDLALVKYKCQTMVIEAFSCSGHRKLWLAEGICTYARSH